MRWQAVRQRRGRKIPVPRPRRLPAATAQRTHCRCCQPSISQNELSSSVCAATVTSRGASLSRHSAVGGAFHRQCARDIRCALPSTQTVHARGAALPPANMPLRSGCAPPQAGPTCHRPAHTVPGFQTGGRLGRRPPPTADHCGWSPASTAAGREWESVGASRTRTTGTRAEQLAALLQPACSTPAAAGLETSRACMHQP